MPPKEGETSVKKGWMILLSSLLVMGAAAAS